MTWKNYTPVVRQELVVARECCHQLIERETIEKDSLVGFLRLYQRVSFVKAVMASDDEPPPPSSTLTTVMLPSKERRMTNTNAHDLY